MWHIENTSDPAPAHASPIEGVELRVRTYQSCDKHAVHLLYQSGLLGGTLDPADPAFDLDRIEQVYLSRPKNHFWVAELRQKVVGTVALTEDADQIAHVRRLRVDPAWRSWHGGEVVQALIREATHHASQQDSLKLILHTAVDEKQIIEFFQTQGFEHARTRERGGRHWLEFYLDLYAVQRPAGGQLRSPDEMLDSIKITRRRDQPF